MRKTIHIIGIALFLIFSFTSISYAGEQDVTISSDLPDLTHRKTLEGTVYIQFNNMDFYNESVKLSWHLYDIDGQDILFENQRVSFSLVDGIAEVPISINLDNIDAAAFENNINICFDLVDENNQFWFSKNPEIIFSSNTVCYIHSIKGEIRENLNIAFQKQPFCFFLNLFVDISFFVLIWWYRKNKKKFS